MTALSAHSILIPFSLRAQLLMMKSSIDFLVVQYLLLCCIAFPAMSWSSNSAANTHDMQLQLGNETDRLALLAFKDEIFGDPFGVMSTWNNSFHFCEWGGVTCGKRHNQRVTSLILESHELSGTISPYIGNLSFLKILDLQNNSLQGVIPPDVARLSRLQYLALNNNSLTGQIPILLSQCANLLTLDLSTNKLTGRISAELASLSKMQFLSLHGNNLIGAIPTSIGNLSSLEQFDIGDNNLDGDVPDSLGGLKRLFFLSAGENLLSEPTRRESPKDLALPNLREFYIGVNKFYGSIPVSLFTNASATLRRLGLSFNNFTGEVPIEVGDLQVLELLHLGANNLGSNRKDGLKFLSSLNNCTSLQVLVVAVNRLRGRLPTSVANLSSHLEEIYLGGNQIFGSIPSEICNLVSLILLALQGNLLTGTIPKCIGMLQKLQLLAFNGNRISGKLPSSIGNLTNLYRLELFDNLLEGEMVTSFAKCKSLQILDLSRNYLNDTIPTQVIRFSQQLTFLNLAHNSFNGSLPSEIGNLKALYFLDISNNKISGEIPSTLGSCSSLEYLYLQGNFLQGPIASLSSLKGIQYLDLSRNNLSGVIPEDFQNLSYITYLNLSYNNIEGEVPTQGIFQNMTQYSILGNHMLCGGIAGLGLSNCHHSRIHNDSQKHRMPPLVLKLMFGLLLPSLILASSLAFYMWRKHQKTTPKQPLEIHNSLNRVSYNDLSKATDGFSSENLIGVGSHGSVYKGAIFPFEHLVAVKVLNLMEQGASHSFLVECKVLRKVRHRNLLKILTVYSSVDFKGNDFKALVFKFMSRGSIENWLHQGSHTSQPHRVLSLLQRLNIMIDVASALDYLHNCCERTIIHCDLKPNNVLLDDDMVAYVADFGLAKFLPKTINSISDNSDTNPITIRGTIGYIPPEYGMGGEISTQGDVYSYGILLLEMFTGKRPTDEMFKDGLTLHQFSKLALTNGVIDIIDREMFSDGSTEDDTINIDFRRYPMGQLHKCLISIVQIRVACSSRLIADRMGINDVLTKLHAIEKAFTLSGISRMKSIGAPTKDCVVACS